MANKQTVSDKLLITYLFIFYLWWAVEEICNWQYSSIPLLQESISALVKFATWSIPAYFLIKKYSDRLAIGYSTMFKNHFRFWPYLGLFILMLIYLFATVYFASGTIRINPSWHPTDLIGSFLIVGITEELVFRGWILNALLPKFKTWVALLIDSILFLVIHFPIWYRTGTFLSNFASGSEFTVIILGILFGLLFIKSKNIFVPIIFHMFWDLILTVFLL